MGLDSYIFSTRKLDENEQIYNKLVDEKGELIEVLYWRKEYNLVDWFGNLLDIEIENCGEYEIGEYELQELIKALESGKLKVSENPEDKINKLKELIKTADFTKTKFIFHNWW